MIAFLGKALLIVLIFLFVYFCIGGWIAVIAVFICIILYLGMEYGKIQQEQNNKKNENDEKGIK